ncbi:MAG: redoxin domain-containing protein [Gemmatimonadales bacterium]
MPVTVSLLPTGSTAPDFTLPSTSGEKVTLSSFRGKKNVLLAFFPFAFTRTCTAELCDLSTDYSRFASAETVVLPISCDFVPALRAYKAKEQMTVDLLGDVRRDVSRAYGVLLEEPFASARAYILIDKTGTIRWQFAEVELGHKRSNGELLAELAKLG